MKRITSVLVFNDLQIACFDIHGQQIPELQRSFSYLFAEHARKNGYDADGVTVEASFSSTSNKWRIVRSPDFDWTWERVYNPLPK